MMASFFRKRMSFCFRTVGAVSRDTGGIAALEFAMLAPLMIFTLLIAADIANALSIERRLTNAADTIAQIVSQQSNVGVVSGSITDVDLVTAFNSIITTFPDVLSDAAKKNEFWTADIEPIVTSVVFGPQQTKTAQNCSVSNETPPTPFSCTEATAVWSVGFNNSGFSTNFRPCGPMTQVQPSTPSPSYTTLPSGLYVPGSAIVVDVTYVFNPMFTDWITGPFTIQRSAYIAPRFFVQLNYTAPNAGVSAGSQQTYTDSSASISLKSCSFTGTLPTS